MSSLRRLLSCSLGALFVQALTPSALADVVTDWNEVALRAVNATATGANPAARALAIQSLAVHDAVASVNGDYETYGAPVPVTQPASPEAAAAGAAAATLSALFPAQAPAIASALATSLGNIPDGAAKQNGIAAGEAAAAALLAARANDGSNGSGTFPGGTQLGQWRPTPPAQQPAAQPFWASVTPFVIERADQFRPPAPPALRGLLYTLSYHDVRTLGAADSTRRSAEQTQIAQFWVPASVVQWNDIARFVAVERGKGLGFNARLFALLNAAIADSRVVAWDAKYHYGTWRPITAIQLGDQDQNPFTPSDATWTPLLPTPNHPDYPSGHSTSGAAAAEVLRRLFGDRQRFTLTSANLPGVTRAYRSFTEAALENGRSRIYGGIHFEFANWAGQTVGRRVGAYTVEQILNPI